MVIHIRHGKRNRDRDMPLSPKLLEIWREYWRWMWPKPYLFPGTKGGWRAYKPITPKALRKACREAAQTELLQKTFALICYAILSRLTAGLRSGFYPACTYCSLTPSSKPLLIDYMIEKAEERGFPSALAAILGSKNGPDCVQAGQNGRSVAYERGDIRMNQALRNRQ
jgi:hypothetical protein